MSISLYASDLSELIVEREYPPVFDSLDGGPQEHCFHMDNAVGKGFYKETYFDGVHIGYGDLALANKTLVHFKTDYETVEMHFTLSGKTAANSKTLEQEISFETQQHNIIYVNGMDGKMEWSDKELRVFEVNLAPAFFRKYLPEDSLFFSQFKKAMDQGYSSLLRSSHNLINLQMHQIIRDIIFCERKGAFKKMFLEAKVIELLLLQLEQLSEKESLSGNLKKADIEKIYAVREFILANLNTACSLIELSHKVGTNEFMLKKGFKELFGTTVFGFWNDAKMEEAMKLLQTQGMKINEVAETIGYKNPQHFSAAFKRKFGVIPSSVMAKHFSS
ncbi:AraC family transcriptional regulator [Pedobacter gandavensis]|uniref:helix-turn-helix transcriptional regulator n=1 Tax=Pedobacter gandavensis TaxID=2679963 RepID=UPI002930C87A|nr:AraC family transcriptional regulator [Pedobacter gandavensis]